MKPEEEKNMNVEMSDEAVVAMVKNMAAETVKGVRTAARNAKNISAYKQGSNWIVTYSAPDGNNRSIQCPYWVKTEKDVKEWVSSQISGSGNEKISFS